MPTASIDVGTVRQRFNFDWATSEPVDGIDTYWWWARSIRVDPNEIIADDDEGNLWSVPFSTDGADAVTFGEPVKVRETYVPVSAGDGAVATEVVQRRRQRVADGGAALERPAKQTPQGGTRPPLTPAATERHDHEENQTMPIDLDQLRTRLGLPEDATEEQINETLAAEQPETFTQDQVDAVVASAREEAAAAASTSDDETVRFDRTTADQLRADAAAGREAREQQIRSERDQLVAAAVEDGRIPPARREHWRNLLNHDPEGTASTLASLEKGLIPVTQRGTSKNDDDAAASDTATTGWFSQLKED